MKKEFSIRFSLLIIPCRYVIILGGILARTENKNKYLKMVISPIGRLFTAGRKKILSFN